MFHSPVPDLFEDFKVSDRQAVVRRRTTRRFCRYGMTNTLQSSLCFLLLLNRSQSSWVATSGRPNLDTESMANGGNTVNRVLCYVWHMNYRIAWGCLSSGNDTSTATSVSLSLWLFLCFLPLRVALKIVRIICSDWVGLSSLPICVSTSPLLYE